MDPEVSSKAENGAAGAKRDLVGQTASKMRALILARRPNEQIGSLSNLAQQLGVGVVTLQQAARVLEHQGFLIVRRGIGGGYYGARPDALALERSLESFLEVYTGSSLEALQMMTLLDCEIMPAAAACSDAALFKELGELESRIDLCRSPQERVAFENDLHDLLFKMVELPLIELFARVSMRYYANRPIPEIFNGEDGARAWSRWRRDLVAAILARDPQLAGFQAKRHRQDLLLRLRERQIS